MATNLESMQKNGASLRCWRGHFHRRIQETISHVNVALCINTWANAQRIRTECDCCDEASEENNAQLLIIAVISSYHIVDDSRNYTLSYRSAQVVCMQSTLSRVVCFRFLVWDNVSLFTLTWLEPRGNKKHFFSFFLIFMNRSPQLSWS